MGEALAYLANHWEGLCLYLDDGRIEIDNIPLRIIRPLALNRKIHYSQVTTRAAKAGHGWPRWSLPARSTASTIRLKATLEAPAAGPRNAGIDMLLAWNFNTPRLATAT
jgi:transposase